MRSLRFSAALLRGLFGFEGIRVMRESAARAVELEDDEGSRWYPLALSALAFGRYLSGEPGVEQPLTQALAQEIPDRAIRNAVLFFAALAASGSGERHRAGSHESPARQLAAEIGLSRTPQSSLAHIAAGLVNADEGRLAEARSLLERALESRASRAALSPWPAFEATVRLASVLLDIGDEKATAARLDEAGEILAALPDGADAQRARLDSLRHRLSPPAVPAGPLTGQERTVLHLLRGTLSMREIGRELNISRNTVKTHVRVIYRKLGVSTRSDAVARGRQLGYLSRRDSLSRPRPAGHGTTHPLRVVRQ
jgi:LuxR family maltose regulon positive regulatory protein